MPLKLYPRPSGYWHIRGTVQRQRIDQSSRTRIRAEAEAIRAKLEADLFQRSVYGDKAVATFAEAATGYMMAGGERKFLAPILKRIGNTRLTEIDQRVVDSVAAEFPHLKPSTATRHIYTPIIAIMTYAADNRMAERIRIRKPKVRDARVDYLTPDEVETFLGLLPTHLARLATFLVGCGPRIGEAIDLPWKDVSPEAERAVFWDTKTGHARGVYIQRRVRPLMLGRPESGEDCVFGTRTGSPWQDVRAINKAFSFHCERNGFRHVHPHLLRHTYATWTYACTRDLTFLMQQGGWRTVQMVMRYAHAASDDLGRAVLAKGWEFSGREIISMTRKAAKIQ